MYNVEKYYYIHWYYTWLKTAGTMCIKCFIYTYLILINASMVLYIMADNEINMNWPILTHKSRISAV